MPITYRDIKQKQDDRLNTKQDKRQQFRAVIVDGQGNQSGAGDIWANQTTRRVWILPVGGVQPFQVLCVRITPVIGLGVICGFADHFSTQVEVLRTDYEFLGPSNTTGTAYESPSNLDFLPGGRLQLWIDDRMIQPLATYSTTGLIVRVVAGSYIYNSIRKNFAGGSIDLSASVPASPGDYRYVGIYLDSAGSLQTVNGTESASTSPAEPTWPDGAFQLSMVRLTNGQTSISISENIVNRRIFASDANSYSGNVWPKAGKININTTEYDTLAEANAAAVAGDLIRLGVGQFDVDSNFTLTADVDLAGSGRNVSTIYLDTGVDFTVPGFSLIQDLSIDAASTEDVNITDAIMINVGFGDIALTIDGGRIEGGLIEGDVTFTNGTYLNFPSIDGTVTGTVGSDWVGYYLDSSGEIVPADDTVRVSKLYESDFGAEAWATDASGGLVGNGTRDIFPQASTNGLNARLERLFGDDVPAATYAFTKRLFTTNDLANNKAGFDDSQSSPYSFGGSPGGFSLSIPAGCTAASSSKRHFLAMSNGSGGAVTNFYLQWTSSTAKTTVSIPLIFVFNNGLGQTLAWELRGWAVQSPGGSDKYWAVRIVYDPTTHAAYPARIEVAYGTGTTISLTDGTRTGNAPFYAGIWSGLKLSCYDSGGIPAISVQLSTAEGDNFYNNAVGIAGYPTSLKTIRAYMIHSYGSAYVDEMVIT